MGQPYYSDDLVTVYEGDCLAVLAQLSAASVDAVVTDPPYGLGFMGREWDALPPGREWAEACYRVLKPGAHLLAFGGTRTWHRLAVAVEDAGFEIRDSIAWLYGSGFPKSLDVSKAIDKAAGAERAVIGQRVYAGGHVQNSSDDKLAPPIGTFVRAQDRRDETAPATDEAARWQGWGTALKPAFEPIVVARKPLAGTVAVNVLAHGTGALNIDACRIGMGAEYDPTKVQRQSAATAGMSGLGDSGFSADHVQATYNIAGRWPANVVLDESQAAALDQQSGTIPASFRKARSGQGGMGGRIGKTRDNDGEPFGYADSGGASRFFYCAKASARERPKVDGVAHPTVKPLALMRWLVRLVTPPGGVVLDPFLGSGTTAEACVIEGFRCIGIEDDAIYIPLVMSRLAKPTAPGLDFGEAS